MVAYLLLAITIIPSYEEALAQSAKRNKPLVVLLGAKWCDPCQVMKSDLMKFGLTDCVIAYVDIDERPDLAKQMLVPNQPIPQIVVFGRPDSKSPWKRIRMVGRQTKDRIIEILSRVIR